MSFVRSEESFDPSDQASFLLPVFFVNFFLLFNFSLVHLLPSSLCLFSQILDLVSRADLETEVLKKFAKLLQSFLLLQYLFDFLLAECDFELSFPDDIKQVIQPILSEVPRHLPQQSLPDVPRNTLPYRLINLLYINLPNILDLNIRLLLLTVQIGSDAPHLPKGFSRRVNIVNLRVNSILNLLQEALTDLFHVFEL